MAAKTILFFIEDKKGRSGDVVGGKEDGIDQREGDERPISDL